MAPRNIERTATGIAGLDSILYGGLPRGQMFLVDGAPGVGKTTLALQYLMQGVRLGERVLYVTLSETASELETVAASHGWTLDGIHRGRACPGRGPLQHHLAEHALPALGSRAHEPLAASHRESSTASRPRAWCWTRSPRFASWRRTRCRYRRQILAFKTHFAKTDCTVLVLDDRSGVGQDVQVQSIVHGVVSLETVPLKFGINRRFLSIPKMRGSTFREGNHDYVIKQGGLTVFPRLVAAEQIVDFEKEVFKSGKRAFRQAVGRRDWTPEPARSSRGPRGAASRRWRACSPRRQPPTAGACSISPSTRCPRSSSTARARSGWTSTGR
jgi:circadian clock protein KaiC